MTLPPDLKEFVELLNSNDVRYLIVGAHAFAYHAKPRFTGDLDIFIDCSRQNAEKVLRVLDEFGMGGLDISSDDLMSTDQVIQLGVEPNRIDLLTTLTGVDFEEAWQHRVESVLDGLATCYIGREQLVRNKRALGRPSDIADLAELGETVGE